MLWQIALALGEERKFIRHLRIFVNNSIPFAQSLRIGHLIHMDGQSVLFCLWGKLKLDLVSICMISILPPAEIRMYAFLEICSKFESRLFWNLHTFFDLIYPWKTLEGGEMENILLFTSTEFGWDGIYQLIMILIFPSTFIVVISTKKSSSSVTSFCLFSYLSYPWWRKINLWRLASKGGGGAFNLYCPNSKM